LPPYYLSRILSITPNSLIVSSTFSLPSSLSLPLSHVIISARDNSICYSSLLSSNLPLMAALTFSQEQKETQEKQPSRRRRKLKKQKEKQPSSWDQIKNLLTCKQIEGSRVHDPSKNPIGYPKFGSSCSSICSFKAVVHGNTRVVHRADNSPESSTVGQETGLLSRKDVCTGSSSTRSLSGPGRSNGGVTHSSSSRGMQFRKLSGCYECHMIVDPSRYISLSYSFFPLNFSFSLEYKKRKKKYRILFINFGLKNPDTHLQEPQLVPVLSVERSFQRLKAWSFIKKFAMLVNCIFILITRKFIINYIFFQNFLIYYLLVFIHNI